MPSIRRPIVDYDMGPDLQDVRNGVWTPKTLFCLHETVSAERVGIADIRGISGYLSNEKKWGVHLIIDQGANSGWCGDGNAKQIYYCAASGRGRVNTRAVHLELISDIPKISTVAGRRKAWQLPYRDAQIEKTARWLAWLHEDGAAFGVRLPLVYSDASKPGITTHWDVSHTYLGGAGHWDCHPINKGGHFPVLEIVARARQIVRDGGW